MKKSGRKKGCVPWNKGIPRTEKERTNISIAKRGMVCSDTQLINLKKGQGWNKGVPQKEETKEKIRKKMKGCIPWNKKPPTLCSCGKQLSRHHYKMCRDCYLKILPDKMRKLNCGKIRSKETRLKMSNAPKCHGEYHRSWKGGVTPLMKKIRKSPKCKNWKKEVFKKNNYICLKCNLRGGNKNAHHIKGFAKIIEENNITTFKQALNCQELWSVDNGITFCDKCHKTFHRIYGEKNNNFKQIKEFLRKGLLKID